jgi:hypothetical protein
LKNDLAGVDCGSVQGPWLGPQAYYRVALQGGVTYVIELSPEPAFDAALYVFPAATLCETAAVNAACQGLSADVLGVGLKEKLTLTPSASLDYLIVVDSWSPSEVGSFVLTISF